MSPFKFNLSGPMLRGLEELYPVVRLSPAGIIHTSSLEIFRRQCVSLTNERTQLQRIAVIFFAAYKRNIYTPNVVILQDRATTTPTTLLACPRTQRSIGIKFVLGILNRLRITLQRHGTKPLGFQLILILAKIPVHRKRCITQAPRI